MNALIFNNTNPPTVEAMRRLGYSVKVNHKRPVIDPDTRYYVEHMENRARERFIRANEFPIRTIREQKAQQNIWPNGGETTITVSKDGQTFTAVSRCSVRDAYNRKSGIRRCLWQIVADINRAT